MGLNIHIQISNYNFDQKVTSQRVAKVADMLQERFDPWHNITRTIKQHKFLSLFLKRDISEQRATQQLFIYMWAAAAYLR